MHNETGLSADIDDARKRLALCVRNGVLSAHEAARRNQYLGRVGERYHRAARLLNPTVFLSFAGDSGEKLLEQVYGAIRKTPSSAFGPNFQVETGMRQSGHP